MKLLPYLKKIRETLLRTSSSRDVALSFPAKLLGGSIPLISVGIVIFQIYSSADEDTILASSGVRRLQEQSWTVHAYDSEQPLTRECLESRCFEQLTPKFADQKIELPAADPLGNKKWDLPNGSSVIYETVLSTDATGQLKDAVLYIPGIRARQVLITVNESLQTDSTGNVPFFVKLGPSGSVTTPTRVTIALRTGGQQAFQGFIRSHMFTGEVQTVYRAHYRLSFRSFPRQAVILFLLSTGALTFAFFIFLDRKRELFALGVAVSVLGVAEAVKVGIIPFLSSKSLFVFFGLHIMFLTWYGLELARLTANVPVLLAAWVTITIAYLTSFALPQAVGETGRFYALQVLNFMPIAVAIADFSRLSKTLKSNREFAVQSGLGAAALLVYGLYLYATDFEASLPFKASSLYEIPVLLCVSVWITAALANLGSLEDRVQAAVVDREKRLQMEQDLKLAEAVQQAFISPGPQISDFFEVHTIYKAAKVVGGDWLAWKTLPEEWSLGIVADVVGKGVQAGLIVSACDAALNLLLPELRPHEDSPEATIRRIVSSLHRAVLSFHANRAMTALIMIGDKHGHFTFSSLGHPPLVVLGGERSRILTTPNNWLSRTFDQTKLNIKTMDLHLGETAVAYTDGVCDGSRQLKVLEKQWREWAHLPLPAMIGNFETVDLNPDRDDQSVMLIRVKSASDKRSDQPLQHPA